MPDSTGMSTLWTRSSTEGIYEGRDRASGEFMWAATPVDLIFGSNPELRAVAEFYASDDAREEFVQDFIGAGTKVMTLDRFNLERNGQVLSKAGSPEPPIIASQ